MILKEKLKEVPGLQFVAENAELLSSAGRRRMLEQPWLVSTADIAAEQNRVFALQQALQRGGGAAVTLRHQLMQLHDLRTTLQSLAGRFLLSEVELFELKNLAFVCSKSRKALQELSLDACFPLPEVQPVFDLLDPDRTGMPNFYIYDSYDPRLAPLRRQMQQASDDEMPDLLSQQNNVQQEVVSRLCDQLHPWAPALADALEQMAYIDFTQARAQLAGQWHLAASAEACDCAGDLRGLFNPRLRVRYDAIGRRYQPVDITLTPGVTLITGANMAGKTVLLKSIGVAQLMYQFGFPVPAAQAAMRPVDDVLFCIGDDQDEMNGLSSFAAEVTRISDALSRSEQQRLLLLIDEPARTTNPVEGKALVQALVQIMAQRDSVTLVTTHYGSLGTRCRRLRVRGFDETLAEGRPTPQTINQYIDYSLVPDDSDEVPHEALRIAEILQAHPAWIQCANSLMQK